MDVKDEFRVPAFWRLVPGGMRRRWWLFRPLDQIARHWPILGRRRGVLVVRMDGIGDMVLFRRSLDHYAEALGVDASDITVLGCDSWKAIAAEVFAGYRVMTIDEHAYARQPLYRFVVNLKVRALAPRTVVCDSYFRRAMMADSLVWVTGAPRKVVSLPYVNEPTRAEYKYYLSQTDEIVDTGPYPTHELVRHARFLSALSGHDVPAEAPVLDWPDRGRPTVVPDGPPCAVLNPGSNEFGRRWPLAGYIAIGRRLLAAGYRVAVVGKGEERRDDHAFEEFLKMAGVLDLRGKTDVPGLMDILNDAAVVVTNDTGPAHLSIGLGAPTVVIVGGGHFGSFVPYPKAATPPGVRFVHHEMDCYHCFWRCPKRASKFETFPCVAAVGEDEVWRAVEAVTGAVVASAAAS